MATQEASDSVEEVNFWDQLESGDSHVSISGSSMASLELHPSFSQHTAQLSPPISVLSCHRLKAGSLFINGNHSIQRHQGDQIPIGKCVLENILMNI